MRDFEEKKRWAYLQPTDSEDKRKDLRDKKTMGGRGWQARSLAFENHEPRQTGRRSTLVQVCAAAAAALPSARSLACHPICRHRDPSLGF
jgi:hypothetical protein